MDSSFVKPLLLWYNKNARVLPWRGCGDPYRIWVSEIMLQQTRVEAVRGYYERFVAALPNVQALAECPEDELLKLWEGLGYYSRARNLQKAAKVICAEHGGELPRTAEELRKLPGIGAYTSGAIASIAFGEAEPAVDGNVLRVYARLSMFSEDIQKDAVRKRVREELLSAYPEADGTWGLLNQAFMDLGSGICRANVPPECDKCPLSGICKAHLAGSETAFPVRGAKTKHRDEERTVFLIRDGENVAVSRRPAGGLLGNLYEFPNCEGWMDADGAVAYIEEKGFLVLTVRELPEAKHVFSHLTWRMRAYELKIAPREERGEALQSAQESSMAELQKAPFEQAWIFAEPKEISRKYALPSAFAKYAELLEIRRGKE